MNPIMRHAFMDYDTYAADAVICSRRPGNNKARCRGGAGVRFRER
jgi:hypothetical protein